MWIPLTVIQIVLYSSCKRYENFYVLLKFPFRSEGYEKYTRTYIMKVNILDGTEVAILIYG